MTLRFRVSSSRVIYLFDIFRHYVDIDVVDKLKLNLSEDDLMLSKRLKYNFDGNLASTKSHNMRASSRYIYQSLAVQIRITAIQQCSTENCLMNCTGRTTF